MTINNRRIQVNDVELNIVTQGKGPVVLLVPGFPDDHTVWRNQVPALVDVGYRVIALDTRGCGESEIKPRESDYAIDKLVADLVALLAYNQGPDFYYFSRNQDPVLLNKA
jgi:pimeloyl-ACP methyl ester carboxylesterase